MMKRLRSEQAMLTAVFCATEVVWFLAGVRFDHADAATTPLYNYVQYVEPALLRDRFFETLYYLHVQPPLFQAAVGVLLRFPERWHVGVFSIAYSGMALGLVLASRALLAELGVDRVTRLIACAFLIVSPPLVLLAKWFYVQMPVAALLMAAALALYRGVCRGKLRYFLGYGASVAAAALVTSYFHLVWVVVMLALGAIGVAFAASPNGSGCVTRGRRGWLTAIMCVPALLVVAVYVKNWMVFDTFTASTWSSVAPSRTARAAVGSEVIERWIAAGRISPLMREDLQEMPIRRILALAESTPAVTGVPVLDQRVRSSGRTNWNHVGLLPVYRRLGQDTRRLAAAYPWAWLRHAMASFCKYQAAATTSAYSVGRNRGKILGWSESFETAFWGAGWGAALDRLLGCCAWVTLPTLVVPLLLVHTVWMGIRPPRRGAAGQADRVTTAFLAANVLYVAAVAIGVADAEYERYHFFSDALVYVLACHACAVWFRRWAAVVLSVPIALCVALAAAPWLSSMFG